MENLKQTPVLGQVLNMLDTYPRISAWVVLSVGIIALLVYEARDVGLTTGNWVALIIASIVVAGLCIWIVSWEDEEETEGSDTIRVTSEVSSSADKISQDQTSNEANSADQNDSDESDSDENRAAGSTSPSA